MSTDHQRYSTENQYEIIEAYAASEIEIVRTYDEGRGPSIAGRDLLKRLIDDVQQGCRLRGYPRLRISRWGHRCRRKRLL